MQKTAKRTRLALMVLVTLLTLPIAQTAAPVAAKQRSRTVARTFSNAAPINLPNGENYPSPVSSSNRYPSAITVDGLKGTIRDVNVRLNKLGRSYPADVQVLLVAPNGRTAIVMAEVGDEHDVTRVTLTLDDEAAAPLPFSTQLQSGVFQPTNDAGAVNFNDPAPAAKSSAALSVFDGGKPAGTWQLFVQDSYAKYDPGSFSGGWTLEITTRVTARKKR